MKGQGNIMNTITHSEISTNEILRESIEKINSTDPDIIQDNSDLKDLERRYESLNIPNKYRRIIDDYIACIYSMSERMETLIYYEGMKNAATHL